MSSASTPQKIGPPLWLLSLLLLFSAAPARSSTTGHVAVWGYGGAGVLASPYAASTAVQTVISGAAHVACGDFHCLALMRDGTVWSWGYNDFGQLGDGTLTPRAIPAPVPRLKNVVAVAVGSGFSVAVKADGSVWAWGFNYHNELGDGTTTNRSVPTPVPGLTDVATVGAGYSHTVALRTDGSVRAWGRNEVGELGDGTTSDSAVPVGVSGLSEPGAVRAISVGGSCTMALKPDGTVVAWGNNGSGQLGDGTTTTRTVPVPVSTLANVKGVAAGSSHSLAMTDDGTVWAWGSNTYGQLGDGTTTHHLIPARVAISNDVIAIGAAGGLSMALRADGTVRAWGNNSVGQLGDGTFFTQKLPVPVVGLTHVAEVSSGTWNGLAVKGDGTIWAWGSMLGGLIGDGVAVSRPTPVPVPGLADAKAVSAGQYHAIALAADGTVWSWGTNTFGQLGDGTSVNRTSPVQVPGLADVVSVSAGGTGSNTSSSLALAAGGAIWAWGSNTGQPGTGTTYSKVPVMVPGLAEVKSVCTSGSHSLALRADGTVWAWGKNDQGQLGDGTQYDRRIPVAVKGLADVSAISAGAQCSLALKTDGTVWLWGKMYSPAHSTPWRVSGLAGVVAISAGEYHCLALSADGTVWGWGQNQTGQIGDGTRTPRVLPVQIPGLTAVTAVSAGRYHSVAATSDGSLWAWGIDGVSVMGDLWTAGGASTVLGDGTLLPHLSPVRVRTISGVVAVQAAPLNTVAIATGAFPDHLTFSCQPRAACAGAQLRTMPVVEARCADETVATTFSGPVALYIEPGSGASGSWLRGTTTVQAVNGVAIFADAAIDKPGSGYEIVAISPGLPTTHSASFDVAVASHAWPDLRRALDICSGIAVGTGDDAHLNTFGPGPGIDLRDAASLACHAAGLDIQP